MNKHPYASYWEAGLEAVPNQSGTLYMMDAHEIPELSRALGFGLPFGRVLDVGCGTGRIARHCQDYLGLDISQDAVNYATRAGLRAQLITGVESLDGMTADWLTWDWVTCLSVFTHIDSAERQDYLKAFAALAPNLLVDIHPGNGSGCFRLWSADPAEFEQQLSDTGWRVAGAIDRPDAYKGDGILHRYYWAQRCSGSGRISG